MKSRESFNLLHRNLSLYRSYPRSYQRQRLWRFPFPTVRELREASSMVAMATSAYPPPPPFYRLYKDYEQDPSSAPEPPPPPPIDQIYTTFGTDRKTNELLPSLESHNLRQLYPNSPNIDFKKELRTLNRELQLHILELADILVERPSQYARRVEDISLIFSNLHHLLNSLRPHQARATLIHMLESQIQRRKQAIEDIKQRREEAQKLLGESLLILDGSQTN
uniref:Mediator of RNA polymerase II transcription subunit 7 n=1 Tax=Setaria italica TaxID=4555 RepID=K3Z9G9_SETIT